MGILSWMIVGLIAGWLAGVLMKGGGYGVVGDIIVGILGGILGGWIASALFRFGANEINLETVLVALMGSVVLIFLLRRLSRRRRRRSFQHYGR